MSEWIFTFGFGQSHPASGQRLDRCFVAIEAPSHSDARREMVRRFGMRWANQYPHRTAAGVDEYGLLEIEGDAAFGAPTEGAK